MFHIFWEIFPIVGKYYSFFWRLSSLALCNRLYGIHVFSNSQNHTVQWFYKGNSHREETPGNQVKPKLALLPISSLNGQMPFTAFERAILPASFVPNCFIWKHPWHISELLACLSVILSACQNHGSVWSLSQLPACVRICLRKMTMASWQNDIAKSRTCTIWQGQIMSYISLHCDLHINRRWECQEVWRLWDFTVHEH